MPQDSPEKLVHFHQPKWGTLEVLGDDAVSWLNGLVSCDVSLARDQVGVWGLLLSKQGKIQHDLSLLSVESKLLIGTAVGRISALIETLDQYIVMEDVELCDRSEELSWFTLYGHGALGQAKQAAPGAAVGAFGWAEIPGAAVVLPKSTAPKVAENLNAQGVVSVDEAEWAGFRAMIRLPEMGSDFSESDNPHEAGLERRTVSFSKGCYLGQEVVCMQDMRGKVKRCVVGLRSSVDVNFSIGQAVFTPAGDPVGELTTVGARGVALGRVKAPHYAAGRELLVGEQAVIVESLQPAK